MAKHSVDYLIVGNSAAGVTAAETIRTTDATSSVLIVSNEDHAAYGRPLISYLLEGKTDLAHIGYKSDDFYEAHDIQTLLGSDYEAVALDPAAHEVSLSGGDVVAYKKCLIATGSVAFVPTIDGLEGTVNSHRFITLDDALGALEEAQAVTAAAHEAGRESQLIVIGGGLIGMKAAEALSHHVDKVMVFEHNHRILPAVLDERGSLIARRLLADRGIECRPGMSAEHLISDDDGRIYRAQLTDESFMDTDMVVIAVGVRPASSIAVAAGAEQGRGLLVDEQLRTSLPDVWAAGDVTQVHNVLDGSDRPLALWPNAVQQGAVAGAYMAGAPDAEPFEGSFAINAVDFFDISLLTSGIIMPPEDGGFEEIVTEEGDTYAKFVVRDGKLMGYVLLNRPENAGVYTAMIKNEVPLSTMSDEVFGRAPLNMDFSQPDRWARLHKLYPTDRDTKGWLRDEGEE